MQWHEHRTSWEGPIGFFWPPFLCAPVLLLAKVARPECRLPSTVLGRRAAQRHAGNQPALSSFMKGLSFFRSAYFPRAALEARFGKRNLWFHSVAVKNRGESDVFSLRSYKP